MYKISIIVPVFNVEDTLDAAFDSIHNQNFGFDNIEVIFIDDASTDSSPELIDEYSNRYSNVKSIHLDSNSGYAGKPRNVGIDNATADYLMFLDPDDEYLPDACSILYDYINENNLNLVSGNFTTTNNGVEKLYSGYKRINLKNNVLKVDSIDEEPDLFSITPSVWCKIVKKEFILKENINFPIGIPGQDLVFVYNCLLNANGIGYVNKPVVRYSPRFSGERKSITAIKTKNNLLGYVKAYHMVTDLFKDNPEFLKYNVSHLNFWSEQFIISNISKSDKLDLLLFASPLFQLYKDKKDVKIKKSLKRFYRAMFNKKYIKAVNLCDLLSLDIYEHVTYIIKNKEIFFIISKNNRNWIDNAVFLKDEGFSVNLINLCDEDINTSLNVIGFQEYYSDNPILSIENDAVNLKDNILDYELNFDKLTDFYNYFVTQLCLECEEKPFLIDPENITNIDSSVVHKISKLADDLNGKKLEKSLRKTYLKDVKKEMTAQSSNKKLKKENKKLKQQYDEILSSSSWKITGPLRKLKRLKK